MVPVSNASLSTSKAVSNPELESPASPLIPSLTVAFPPFRLAESDAPLLTVGEEKAFLPYVAQHPLLLHFFSKALEQLLLRLALSQCDGCQLNSPPFVIVGFGLIVQTPALHLP